MTAVLEASGLGKRYRRTQALTDCTLSIPAGRVAGLDDESIEALFQSTFRSADEEEIA